MKPAEGADNVTHTHAQTGPSRDLLPSWDLRVHVDVVRELEPSTATPLLTELS